MVRKNVRDDVESNDDGEFEVPESVWGFEDFKLEKKHIDEAKKFDRMEALILVNTYYDYQARRKAMANKKGALERGASVRDEEKYTPVMIQLAHDAINQIELQIAKGLAAYAKSRPLGQWMLSIPGVGPVLAAGLMAHVNFQRCCCEIYKGVRESDIPEAHKKHCPGLVNAGHLISFAGQCDPAYYKWEKGTKRPYNLRLKVLTWNLGESFKKQAPVRRYENLSPKQIIQVEKDLAKQNGTTFNAKKFTQEWAEEKKLSNDEKMSRLCREEFMYVRRYYNERKKQEVENERGTYKEKALGMLRKADDNGWGISPEQRAIWGSGKLQPKGLDLRAMRYATRLFLNHFFFVGRTLYYGEAPKPWVIEHGGHTHYIPAPNFPLLDVKKPKKEKV